MRRPMWWGVECVLSPFRIIPPTESLSGLRPQLFVGLPEEERPTLKGGVIVGCSARGKCCLLFRRLHTLNHESRPFSTAPLRGDNPPYPPLTGGQEKANPPQPGEGASPFCIPLSGGLLFFYTPLSRGGRGGWFFSVPGQVQGPVPADAGIESRCVADRPRPRTGTGACPLQHPSPGRLHTGKYGEL